MKVTNELKLYEMDGVEAKAIDGPVLLVRSHWVRREMVVLIVGGHEYTVARSELAAAIGNATNTGRY